MVSDATPSSSLRRRARCSSRPPMTFSKTGRFCSGLRSSMSQARDLSANFPLQSETHPAVRRAYRKWVAELVDRDPAAADRLFQAAVVNEDVPAQFRDDMLVSLLRAPSSPAFLERHGGELLANDKDLLRRVIHLLRVACVITPAWLPTSAGHGSFSNVPDGPAWACVLRLVQTHLREFAPRTAASLGIDRGLGSWRQLVGTVPGRSRSRSCDRTLALADVR